MKTLLTTLISILLCVCVGTGAYAANDSSDETQEQEQVTVLCAIEVGTEQTVYVRVPEEAVDRDNGTVIVYGVLRKYERCASRTPRQKPVDCNGQPLNTSDKVVYVIRKSGTCALNVPQDCFYVDEEPIIKYKERKPIRTEESVFIVNSCPVNIAELQNN